jgi:hypothetical protein
LDRAFPAHPKQADEIAQLSIVVANPFGDRPLERRANRNPMRASTLPVLVGNTYHATNFSIDLPAALALT